MIAIGDGYVAIRTQEALLSPTSAFNRRDSTVCYTSCRPIVVTTSSSSPRMLITSSLPFIPRGEKPRPCFAKSLRGKREVTRKEKADGRSYAPIRNRRNGENERACRDKNGLIVPIKRYTTASGDLRWLESRDESESTRASRISSIETQRFLWISRETKRYSCDPVDQVIFLVLIKTDAIIII